MDARYVSARWRLMPLLSVRWTSYRWSRASGRAAALRDCVCSHVAGRPGSGGMTLAGEVLCCCGCVVVGVERHLGLQHGARDPEQPASESIQNRGSPALCVDRVGSALMFGTCPVGPHRTGHERTLSHAGLPRRTGRTRRPRLPPHRRARHPARRALPGLRAGEPRRAQPLASASGRPALAREPGPRRPGRAPVLLPHPVLRPTHFRRAPAGVGGATRPAHAPAGRDPGTGRGGARRRGRRQVAVPARHAGERRHRAAPGLSAAPARAGAGARGGRGRLGAAQRAHLRHDCGGPGAPPHAGPLARPHGRDAGRLAAGPARHRGRRPRPLDRVCPRHRPRRAGGSAGFGPLAPAGQHAPGARALAGRGAGAASAPAGPART